jgi:anti-anti-sigma regulatory factor
MYQTELTETASNSHDFDFWTWTLDGIPVVSVLSTYIDIDNTNVMRRELEAAAARSKVIVVDMSEKPFCDSSGMNLLDEIARKLADQGGELRAVITHRITRMFILEPPSGRPTQVRVFSTLDEAVFAAQRGPKPQLQAA